jgi:hypothetical protein
MWLTSPHSRRNWTHFDKPFLLKSPSSFIQVIVLERFIFSQDLEEIYNSPPNCGVSPGFRHITHPFGWKRFLWFSGIVYFSLVWFAREVMRQTHRTTRGRI